MQLSSILLVILIPLGLLVVNLGVQALLDRLKRSHDRPSAQPDTQTPTIPKVVSGCPDGHF